MAKLSYNVFISWSGDRSKKVAHALHKWVPMVIQTAKPFLSSEDIQKGLSGIEELSRVLDSCSVAIICLTPENVNQPWILFEAGAISKRVKNQSHVCTFLFEGMTIRDVAPPLNIFQATTPTQADVLKLLQTLNTALSSDKAIGSDQLSTLFNATWSILATELESIPKHPEDKPQKRGDKQMLENMYEAILSISRQVSLMAAEQQEQAFVNRFAPFGQPNPNAFSSQYANLVALSPPPFSTFGIAAPKRFAVRRADGEVEYFDGKSIMQLSPTSAALIIDDTNMKVLENVQGWTDLNTGESFVLPRT